jgi:hypothetical protein
MAKIQKSPSIEEHAVSFFGPARDFQRAADLLLRSDSNLRSPIDVLYFHAIELALKAFLRAYDIPIVAGGVRKHHRLTDLYSECNTLGLKISGNDQTGIKNIVSLFDANSDQGLRYFNIRGSVLPELSWTCEVVERLMAVVERHVNERAAKDGVIDGRAVKKINFIASKPEDVKPRK